MPNSRDSWLQEHAYLAPLARFCAEVEDAALRIDGEPAAPPDFEAYRSDFLAGVPLLRSASAAIDFDPVGRRTVALVDELGRRPRSGPLAEEFRAAGDPLRRDAAAASRVASWLLGDAGSEPARPGLLRYLGWRCATRHLRRVLDAFAQWRDESRWLRNYCPCCGSPPAMAQLIGIDPGRMRYLVCGACTTRWRYSRTGCPFCEVDTRKIAIVTVEGGGGLRLDWCESCRAYLKTCEGQAGEELLLSDWGSLHLDVVAQKRGLVRKAASLFTLDELGAP